MKVKTAKTAGFCFGVKRAVDKVYELIENGRNLSFCSEDTQDRGTGKQGWKTDYHIWRSFPPGGKRDLRMVRGFLYCSQKQRGCRKFCPGSGANTLHCFADDI